MRYFGLLLLLTPLVGCDRPVAGPGADNTTDGDSATHTVNRPVMTDDAAPATNATSDSTNAASDTTNGQTRKDNTAVNQRDRSEAAKTPGDQHQDTPDINLTADIRKKIVNHSGMSINARNVKIVSEDGKVTLRGPVNSQEEKDLIDKFAKESAGADKVDNQLEIAP